LFIVEDAGGAFPEGSTRFDLFFENSKEGRDWYDRTSRVRVNTSGFIQQEIPPPLEESSNP
jgi:hypothetical protein